MRRFIIFLAGALSVLWPTSVRAAEDRDFVDAATVNRAFHLYNVAICLDCPALIVTDLDKLRITAPPGEKLKGPPPADAETIEILEKHCEVARATYLRITALFIVGAMGGEAETQRVAGANLCHARARIAWAKADAAATLSWLEQAVDLWEAAGKALTASWEPSWVSPEQFTMIQNGWLAATLNAYQVRKSCEALQYDISNLGQQPKLNDGSLEPKFEGEFAQWLMRPQRFSTEDIPSKATITSLVMPPWGTDSFCRDLLLQKASAYLNVTGAAPADDQTTPILEQHLLRAANLYRSVKQIADSGAKGGGIENRSLAACHFCRSHAAVSWVKADVIGAISWLQRSQRWNDVSIGVIGELYEHNLLLADALITAQNLNAQSRLTLLFFKKHATELRRALETRPDSTEPSTIKNGNRSEIASNFASRDSRYTAWNRQLHQIHLARCLGLPPLLILGAPSRVGSRSETTLPPAEPWIIDSLLDGASNAVHSCRRITALYVVGAMGGEADRHARAAARVCLSRTRLEWGLGETSSCHMWLERALPLTHRAAHTSLAAFKSGPAPLAAFSSSEPATTPGVDVCISTIEVITQAELAAIQLRRSRSALGLPLATEDGKTLFSIQEACDSFSANERRISDEYRLFDLIREIDIRREARQQAANKLDSDMSDD